MDLVALSALVVSINLTVMSVAFDSLRRDFPGTELSVMGWVLSIYTIVFRRAVGARRSLADHLGRRTIFLWGLGIIVGLVHRRGLAPAVWVIILGRVGQGVGAACLVPSDARIAPRCRARRAARISYRFLQRVGVRRRRRRPNTRRAADSPVELARCLLHRTGARGVLLDRRYPLVARDQARPVRSAAADMVGSLLVVMSLSAFSLGILQSRDWGWIDKRTIGALVLAVVAGRRSGSARVCIRYPCCR